MNENNPWYVYIDGAYSKKCPEGVAIGIALLDDRGNKYQKSAFLVRNDLADKRNVGAELAAAYIGARIAFDKGCRNLVMYHDYMGVANWITKSWSANTKLTQAYAKAMQADFIDQGMPITFKYVRAHSGNVWNEYADKLATQAITKRIVEKSSVA